MTSNITQIVKEWEEYLLLKRAYSSHSVSAYLTDLKNFFAFLLNYTNEEITLEKLKKLDHKDLRSWIARQKTDGKISSSVARGLSAVKNFYKFLDKYYDIKNDKIFVTNVVNKQNKIIRSLSSEDAKLSLDLIQEFSKENWVASRDKAILSLLYGCGLRISEALNLTPKDLNPKFLIIKGKGNKERLVPMIENVHEAIMEYIKLCPVEFTGPDKIFIGVQGKPLNPAVFQKNIRNLRNSYGLNSSTTPHSFRHSYATHLLENGADIRVIQELLGHQNLNTTERYTKLNTTKIISEYQKLHPRK